MSFSGRNVLPAGLLLAALAGCDPVGIRVVAKTPDTDRAPTPPLETKDHLGRGVSIDAALARGPVALVFYRGFW